MRHLALAVSFLAALALSATAFAQEPQQAASPDGKSVPMQQAPEKIKPGRAKAKHHSMKHSKKM